MNTKQVSVRVTGEFACWTRAENKVERMSYRVMPPSAARGIMEAIYWHPQFRWRIDEIQVLRNPRTFSILRNEVNSKMSLAAGPLVADEDRTQRHAVCLRDVDYVIVADAVVHPGVAEHPEKFRDQFRRRVNRGQCFHRPALGTREFAADFGPSDDAPAPVEWTEDLGLMLWDLDFSKGRKPYMPLFFRARIDAGVMRIPAVPDGGAE